MKCPICKREVSENEYLPGLKKCVRCVQLIKEVRESGRCKCVACLRLFYGKII